MADTGSARLLELVRDALGPMVSKRLSDAPPDRPFKGSPTDVWALLTFVTRNPSLFRELNKKALNCAHEILTDRNSLAHQEVIDPRRLADTVRILLTAIAAPQLAEVTEIQRQLQTAGSKPSAVSELWPEITVVACTASKRRQKARAEHLYDTSPLFRLCVEQVRADGRPWLIVSSLHGLVRPAQELESYTEDPKKWSNERRIEWTRQVTDQASRFAKEHGIQRVSMLAGQSFRPGVSAAFSSAGARCEVHPEWNRIWRQAFESESDLP